MARNLRILTRSDCPDCDGKGYVLYTPVEDDDIMCLALREGGKPGGKPVEGGKPVTGCSKCGGGCHARGRGHLDEEIDLASLAGLLREAGSGQ